MSSGGGVGHRPQQRVECRCRASVRRRQPTSTAWATASVTNGRAPATLRDGGSVAGAPNGVGRARSAAARLPRPRRRAAGARRSAQLSAAPAEQRADPDAPGQQRRIAGDVVDVRRRAGRRPCWRSRARGARRRWATRGLRAAGSCFHQNALYQLRASEELCVGFPPWAVSLETLRPGADRGVPGPVRGGAGRDDRGDGAAGDRRRTGLRRPASLPWVVTAYTLVFGRAAGPGGRVADLVGAAAGVRGRTGRLRRWVGGLRGWPGPGGAGRRPRVQGSARRAVAGGTGLLTR